MNKINDVTEWWCEIGHLNLDQRDFLGEVLTELKPKYTLETGTSTGRGSATILCYGNPKKHVSVDINLDGAEGCVHNRSFIMAMLQEFDNFFHFEGDSRTILTDAFFEKEFPHGVDFFFVDGGHTYEVAYSDMRTGWSRINYGGYMIVDDYMSGLPNGYPIPAVTAAVNDFALENGLEVRRWNKDGKGLAIFIKKEQKENA